MASANQFLDEDEVDDEEFLNYPNRQPLENKRLQLFEERRRIEERTLQSSYNSLGLLHESEQVGILTAEELLQQREQLQNIEGNLDNINSTMKTSQKHINSIKSIFGGLKNYLWRSGSMETARSPSEWQPKESGSRLADTLGEVHERAPESSHPAFRARNLPYADSIDSEEILKKPTSPAGLSTDTDQKLDQNLDSLCMGLGRLKNLAVGLHDEIEQQNEMIDVIHNKADKADETLEYQNRQIKRILKK